MKLTQRLFGAALAWAAIASTSGAGVISHASLPQPAAQAMHMQGLQAAPVTEADTWLMMGLGVALMAGGLALMRAPSERSPVQTGLPLLRPNRMLLRGAAQVLDAALEPK